MNSIKFISKVKEYFFSTSFNKGDYVITLILGVLVLILCVAKNVSDHMVWSDEAAYISQTIAIIEGKIVQYNTDNTLMTIKNDWRYAYPWGYPILLIPLYKIFGLNIFALKFTNIICYVLFVGIFYIFCAKQLPRIYALFAALFFALNPYMTYFVANNVSSDIPFMLFGFTALIILAKLFGKSNFKYNPCVIAIFGGFFMLFATMIRMNGFVILYALIAMHSIMVLKHFTPNLFNTRILKPFSHIDSPYPWQIHAIPYIIFASGFIIMSIILSSGGSRHWNALEYISIENILHNFYYYTMRLSRFFELSVRDFIILAVCLVPFLILGLKNCLKSTESSANIFYIIFMLGFFTLLLLWVKTFGTLRFMFLLLPFLVFWSLMGFAKSKTIYGYIMSIVLVIIFINFVHFNILDIDFKDKSGRKAEVAVAKYTPEIGQIWDFIKQNTPPNAMVLFGEPHAVYLYTNRLSFVTDDIGRLDEADFVLWWIGYEGLNVHSPAFKIKTKLIFQNAEYKLFKVLK